MVPFPLSQVAGETDTFQGAIAVKAFLRAVSISSVKDNVERGGGTKKKKAQVLFAKGDFKR